MPVVFLYCSNVEIKVLWYLSQHLLSQKANSAFHPSALGK